jgi:glutaredoxin 3
MITIFTKDYCPYCTLAKDFITGLGFKYQEIDVTNDEEKCREIKNLSGMMTVPQIFA